MKSDTKKHESEVSILEQALAQTSFADSATVAWRHYRLQAVACDTPFLIIPFMGHKRFYVDSKSWECHVGQFLMSHFSLRANIENFPERSKPYRAWVISFPWEVLDIVRNLLTGQQIKGLQSSQELVSVGDISFIAKSLLSYITDSNSHDNALRNYRLLGILLELYRAGYGQFLRSKDPSYSSRIRMFVTKDPSREWTSAFFEEAFYMSGATLRRRLASEGTSLRDLIQEARLHSALMQLQTSSNPLKLVATAHGFSTVSSFSQSFSKRFGVEPAQVSNHKLSV